ncbi:PCRF domain-containing protein, partial [Casaltella massiliensis]|nr:PCRF domain-containing protein [Casaltella massiliensis]
LELAQEEADDLLEKEVENTITSLEKEIDKVKIKTLLSGEYDRNNAILSINAGTGGLDAQDWAEMLLRMYDRWANSKGFKVKTLDLQSDTEAGIKSAT